MSRPNTAPRTGPSSATRPSPPVRGQFDPACQVHINGLTMETMSRDVMKLFRPYGPIVDMALSATRDGHGSGTITFGTPSMAARVAKECAYCNIEGRGVRVERVIRQPEPAPTSGQEERPLLRDHHEFARLLRITDEPEGYNSEAFDREEQKEIISFMSPYETQTDEQLLIFWALVSASFLPQLVRTQIEYPFPNPPMIYDFVTDWDGWMISLLRSIQANRFVRERPDEAIALEGALVSAIARSSIAGINDALRFDPRDLHPVTSHLHMLLALWVTLRLLLSDYLSPPLASLPPPAKQTRRRIRSLRPVLAELKRQRPIPRGYGYEPLDRFYEVYGDDEGGKELGGDGLSLEARRTTVRWWACERTVDAEGGPSATGEELGKCEEMKEGMAMDACSRCGAVRYCSRAHREVHWPIHQLVCIRPRW